MRKTAHLIVHPDFRKAMKVESGLRGISIVKLSHEKADDFFRNSGWEKLNEKKKKEFEFRL